MSTDVRPTEEISETLMSEAIGFLRDVVTDYDGSAIADGAEPRLVPSAGIIRAALKSHDEWARLKDEVGSDLARALATIEQLRQKLGSWVGVDDYLPPQHPAGEDVQVWTWDGETVEEDFYGECFETPVPGGGSISSGWHFDEKREPHITHWMFRTNPEPPR